MDEEEDENMLITELNEEIDQWKAKYKKLELQKRQSDLSLNKIKTEINSLRSVDKQWKDSAKTVYLNLNDMQFQFDSQIDQIMAGLDGITKSGERVTSKIPYNRKLKSTIAAFQKRIADQEETIMTLNAKIRVLTTELADKTAKVERLSAGIDEEVERLMKPMRDRLSDAMIQIMKEKAARAQERRELADLWPQDRLMPSLLMKHRALSDEERERRVKVTTEMNASYALSQEIRANVSESKMWEMKYDDYGRAFYEHMKTGETLWEPPEIMSYKPPNGRDEMGNVLVNEESSMAHWMLMTDTKGEVYYKHKQTGEITYIPPNYYKEIPRGKAREAKVGEGAQLVLEFVKEKISKHIERSKELKDKLENPLTPEDLKRIEKEEKGKTAEEKEAEAAEKAKRAAEDAAEPIELSAYQYDIETIEMLADILSEDSAGKAKKKDKEPDVIRQERRAFMADKEVRKFDPDLFIGQTIAEIDLETVTVPQLRGIVEELALSEEKLEKQTKRVRDSIKDFSFVLMERMQQEEIERAEQQRVEAEEREKERRAQQKQFMIEKQEEAKRKAEEQKRQRLDGEEQRRELQEHLEDERKGLLELEPGGVDGADEAVGKTGGEGMAESKGSESKGADVKEGAPGVSADGVEVINMDDAAAAEAKADDATFDPDASLATGSFDVGNDANARANRKKKSRKKAKRSMIDDRDAGDAGLPGETDSLSDDDDDDDSDDSDEESDDDESDSGRPLRMDPDDPNYFETGLDPKITNYGAMLFGDAQFNPSEPDYSEEMVQVSSNLANFSLFCGFTALHLSEAPNDYTVEYSLMLDDCRGAHDPSDDDWLTSSFFINCTAESLDALRAATREGYSASAGLLPIGPLDPEVLVLETPQMPRVERSQDKSYTYGTSEVEYLTRSHFESWKARQLMTEVLRQQIQRQAIQEAYEHRQEAFQDVHLYSGGGAQAQQSVHSLELSPHAMNHIIPLVTVKVQRIHFDLKFSGVMANQYYAYVKIGSWVARTPPQEPTPQGFVWDMLGDTVSGSIPVNDIQLDYLIVEILDQNPSEPTQAFIGKGRAHIDHILGFNVGRNVVVDMDVIDVEKAVLGKIKVTLKAEVDQFAPAKEVDPRHLEHYEINTKLSEEVKLETALDKESPSVVQSVAASAPSTALSERFNSLRNLVADLRGDGVEFIRLLTGDVTVDDVKKVHADINTKVAKNLPNFKQASKFLEKKANRHRWELDQMLLDIESEQKDMIEFLDAKFEKITKNEVEVKARLQKMRFQVEDLKREVLRAQKTVADARKIPPEPKQPEFEDFPPVPYVPKLPVSGGLDGRGKKKKPLKNEELKVLLEQVINGDLDGLEVWPMPENKFPSQAQLLKLGKSMTTRNGVLDAKRSQEKQTRDKLNESYELDHERWTTMEKKRVMDLEVAKKECRKVNMKYDSFMEQMDRTKNDYEALEFDLNTIADLKNLNDKSLARFKIMRFKQQLEFTRLKEYLQNLKKRLMRCLKARRFALDLPGTAQDDLQYAKLVRQSEAALGTLRLEIFECKHLLQAEGWRMRTLFEEEYKLASNELARIRMSREVVMQRDSFDQILARYRYEVGHLLRDMEKLKAAETDRDETGQETVDDLGERYIPEKKWQSPEIQRLQKLIDIVMAKINLTDGLGKSTGQSQKLLMDVMAVKYGADILPMRDSWTENADFVRAQRLLEDTLQWAQSERRKINELRQQTGFKAVDLGLQLEAARAQQKVAVDTHETETLTIAQHSSDVIEVIREHLKDYREETSKKVEELESSIVELSRECQGVRENLLAQQLQFDEKIKVLWAFIHTLQTAVQQLSARMEMVLEEREKIVIESKLVADRMRHHLRLERKHCSNLLFVITSQRGTVKFLTDVIAKLSAEAKAYMNQQAVEKGNLRREIWEQIFAFTRLGTDVDALFEFFAARLANLAGARGTLNNALARNGAAQVLAALCQSPKPLIRKYAARAIGGMGWDGFVETRILLWDCVMYWKIYKASVIAKETKAFQTGLDAFNENGQFEAILNIKGEVEEFVPSGNMSLRTIIKQRRQWALRAARRREGPNMVNQKDINVKDGVIPALLEMCLRDGAIDWEISRNAALAISIASYEPSNHQDMAHTPFVREMIINMCNASDPEVQTHAAVTVANLCHKDEMAQQLFGESGAVEVLIDLSICSVVDVLEATTSALANLTCYCDINCKRALEYGAVKSMVRVITHAYSQNLLDLDQNDEVQANAAEVLANISRYGTEATLPYFDAAVIDALVLMCASSNKQLRRHVPLVLGNIAQSENCRYQIGVKGGIESLFLVIEDNDNAIQANTMWALCNLMWHPPNQERAGRFITEVVEFLKSPWVPTRTQAITLLANMLYYNNPNRIRLLECEGAMELLLHFVQERADTTMVEGGLRALLSISYIDGIAMWLGPEGGFIPLFISYLLEPYFSRDSMRYSLEILCNLCLHHANRRLIYENHGIDAIVALHIDEDVHIQELSKQIIGHLEDITPPDVLARAKVEVGLDRMVTLASSTDPLVRAVAAESIGEEIWHDPKKQSRAHKLGGIDALLSICANPREPVESVLPALWSLRNLIHDNSDAKAQFGYRDGVSVVNAVFLQTFSGRFVEQAEKVLEAGVACLTTAAAQDEKNARKVLMLALPALIDMADGRVRQLASLSEHLKLEDGATDPESGTPLPARLIEESKKALHYLHQAVRADGVQSLARSLLLQMAPYNYVVCRNCHRKQELTGTSCYNCGYRLLLDIDIPEVELRRLLKRAPFINNHSTDPAGAVGGVGMPSGVGAKGVMGLKRIAAERDRERGGGGGGGGIRTSSSAPTGVTTYSGNLPPKISSRAPIVIDDSISLHSSSAAMPSGDMPPGQGVGKGSGGKGGEEMIVSKTLPAPLRPRSSNSNLNSKTSSFAPSTAVPVVPAAADDDHHHNHLRNAPPPASRSGNADSFDGAGARVGAASSRTGPSGAHREPGQGAGEFKVGGRGGTMATGSTKSGKYNRL